VMGVVKDENGDPVVGMLVETGKWRDRTTLGLKAMTDIEGRFVIEDAPTDEFELAVMPKFGEAITQTVRGGAHEKVTFVTPVAPVRDAPRGLEGLQLGDVAPTLEITTRDGKKIKTSELTGKVVLLDFWATWCAPCLEEMPYILGAWEKYGDRDDFVLIGLSRDYDMTRFNDYMKLNSKITWPMAVGVDGGVESAAEKFGVTWIPRVYLIDKNGKVAGKNLRGVDVLKEVGKLLTTKDPT